MKNNLPSRECLYYLNYEEELTYYQISLLYDVSKHSIYKWFKKRELQGKNNQEKKFPSLSKEIISRTAYKNRKFTVNDYNGKSKLLNPESFINVQSKLKFKCECGKIFERSFYYAINSNINNICNDCQQKLISELYHTEKYQKIFKDLSTNREQYNRSKQEIELYNFVKLLIENTEYSLKENCSVNDKNVDIFIPELKLCIEFNGLAFHSEMLYHVFKTKSFRETRFLHKERMELVYPNRMFIVWEDDWNDKQDIVKNQLKFLINGPDKRIFARKTEIIKPNIDAVNKFYETHHIQGKVKATIHYGLIYNNELIACVSFTKRESEFELVRYCSKYQVIGGFSKLVKHFVKYNEFTKLYSFADLNIVYKDNNVYKNNGWKEEKYLAPDYKYIVNGKREHKFNFRHKSLKNRLKYYDPNLSEYQNCLNNGIYKIWDCGKIKYSYPR